MIHSLPWAQWRAFLSIPRYATCNIHDRQGASLKGGRERRRGEQTQQTDGFSRGQMHIRPTPTDRNVENRIEVSHNGKKKSILVKAI